MKHENESHIEFGMRLWDTADPPITVSQAARLAGIRTSATLSKALFRREYYATRRCPTCHQLPGKPRDNYGRHLLAQEKLPHAQSEIHMTHSELIEKAKADLRRLRSKYGSTRSNSAPRASPQE